MIERNIIQSKANKYIKGVKYLDKNKYLYLLLAPCVMYFIIFHYIPMYGIIIAFKDFSFVKGILGSSWIGLDNFKYMFSMGDFYQVFANSMILSGLRILVVFPIPIILALMLNEFISTRFKKVAQTVLYLPHFISWVVIGGIMVNLLSPNYGLVNYIIKLFGGQAIFCLAEPKWFRPLVLMSSIWKEAGWGTIIYLAAITGINEELYEAAYVDGASRWQRLLFITIPGIKSTIIMLFILRIGQVMNNGFEQIFVLQNTQNLSVSEVFETFTYRIGLVSGRYSFSTAVGFFTSTISLVLLTITNKLAKVLGEEGLW